MKNKLEQFLRNRIFWFFGLIALISLIVKISLLFQNIQIISSDFSKYLTHLAFSLGFLEFFLAPFGLQVMNSPFPTTIAVIFSSLFYIGMLWFFYKIKKWDLQTLKIVSCIILIIVVITAIGHSSVITTPIQ